MGADNCWASQEPSSLFLGLAAIFIWVRMLNVFGLVTPTPSTQNTMGHVPPRISGKGRVKLLIVGVVPRATVLQLSWARTAWPFARCPLAVQSVAFLQTIGDSIVDLKPRASNPGLSTLNPEPCALNPATYALKSDLKSPNPEPCVPYSTTETLNPEP